MTDIQKRLFDLQDKDYADFQSKLMPTVEKEKIIGVRVPQIRMLAKSVSKEPLCESFLENLPHKYYDEDMFHAVLISEIKDYEICVEKLERFLPYVDNWAVCDIMSPKIFKNHKTELLEKIYGWAKSSEVYTCRFGIGMLMTHFLKEDFKEEYLFLPASIKSEEYYVNMMIAWFFATALAKQWNTTIPYIENRKLDQWVHKKTIQKACESYRITAEQKEYLKTLK